MSTSLKRFFFWGLFTLFTIYTVFIYITGAENNPGKSFITENSKKGKLLFQEYNCISCHQIYGLGGYMGPDLTNVISASGKGPAYVKSFIKNGTLKMPNFNLNDDEVNAITEYLTYIDKTGISPVKNFDIEIDGTITQKTTP